MSGVESQPLFSQNHGESLIYRQIVCRHLSLRFHELSRHVDHIFDRRRFELHHEYSRGEMVQSGKMLIWKRQISQTLFWNLFLPTKFGKNLIYIQESSLNLLIVINLILNLSELKYKFLKLIQKVANLTPMENWSSKEPRRHAASLREKAVPVRELGWSGNTLRAEPSFRHTPEELAFVQISCRIY